MKRDIDARDLAIPGFAAAGLTIGQIARALRIKRRVVRRVLAEDAREFQNEPLIAAPLQPGGAC